MFEVEKLKNEIRALLEARGWSHTELAIRLGMSPSTISKLLRSDGNPSLATFDIIKKGLLAYPITQFEQKGIESDLEAPAIQVDHLQNDYQKNVKIRLLAWMKSKKITSAREVAFHTGIGRKTIEYLLEGLNINSTEIEKIDSFIDEQKEREKSSKFLVQCSLSNEEGLLVSDIMLTMFEIKGAMPTNVEFFKALLKVVANHKEEFKE